jgi:propionyl-CoA synthetase
MSLPLQHLQDKVHQASLDDPEKFWMAQAEHLYWHKKPSKALRMGTKKLPSGVEHTTWEWFPDGEISTCYNQVDRHVLAGNGDAPAIYYDSPVTCQKRAITYNELLSDVETLAGDLREAGVQKGDVVLCYSE